MHQGMIDRNELPQRQIWISPPPERIAVAVNRAMLFLAALTVTVIFFMASFQPFPVLLPTMSSLLTSCAFAAIVLAVVRVQRLNSAFLTFWDLAAIWLFLAIGLGLLTDHAAVEAHNASVVESATPAPPPPAPAATN